MPTGQTSQCPRRHSDSHNVALAVQNQSKFNGATTVDNSPSSMLNEASSSSIPSISDVVKNFKRPLENEINIDDKIKKSRLDEQLNVKCLNHENEESHVNGYVSDTGNNSVSVIDSNEFIEMSKESNKGNCENDKFIKHPKNIDATNEDFNSASKMSISIEENQNNKIKSSNINNHVPQVIKNYIESTGQNDIVENSVDNFFKSTSVVEDLWIMKKQLAGNKVIQTKNNSNTKEADLKRKEDRIKLCKSSIIDPTLLKGTDNIKMPGNDFVDNKNKGEDEIESVNDSEEKLLIEEIDNKTICKVIDDVKQHGKNGSMISTEVLFKFFQRGDLLYERFQTFFMYKLIEYLTDSGDRGIERYNLSEMHESTKLWYPKMKSISNYIYKFSDEYVEYSRGLKPQPLNKCLREVSMQVDLIKLKPLKGYRKPNKIHRPLIPVQQSNNDPVDISSDDDDIIIDRVYTNPSSSPIEKNTKKNNVLVASKSTKSPSNTSGRNTKRNDVLVDTETTKLSSPVNEKDTTSRKQSLIPSTSKLPMASTSKTVPNSVPINPLDMVEIDQIDLTENDEVNVVSTKFTLDTTFVFIRRSTTNTSTSTVTSSSQLTRNLSTQDLPNLSPSSSNKMKTSSATPYLLKPDGQFEKLVPIQLNDHKQSQPTTSTAVTYSPRQLPTSRIIGSQITPQTMKSQLIRTQLVRSHRTIPQLTQPKPSRPLKIRPQQIRPQQIRPQEIRSQEIRPQEIRSQLSRPQLIMSQSSRPQIRPVPPAIPISVPVLRHPAPLPLIPNQKSLPTWKELPPSPSLDITTSTSDPTGMVLSWDIAVTRSIAEITTYHIFVYHVKGSTPRSNMWVKMGDVNALPLPMACSLSQFRRGERYYFAVRAVDVYNRFGPFSIPQFAMLNS